MMVNCNSCTCMYDNSTTSRCPSCDSNSCYSMGQERPRIPEFIKLLEQMKEIHLKKNKDYASEESPFENFERSAELMNWFDNPVDKSFINLIGTKLARLSTLLNKKEGPENESIEDSFLDLCTYCALWASYRKKES